MKPAMKGWAEHRRSSVTIRRCKGRLAAREPGESAQLQMQQRIRSSGLVGFAASDQVETSTSIELHRLAILFIHIDVPDAVIVDGAAEKSRADAGAALLSVDEQHLEVSVEDTRESHRSTIQLCDGERHSGEVVRLQFGFDLTSVRLGKEVVSRVDRASPDGDEGRKVLWSA